LSEKHYIMEWINHVNAASAGCTLKYALAGAGVELLPQLLHRHRRCTSKNKKGALCPIVLNVKQNITLA